MAEFLCDLYILRLLEWTFRGWDLSQPVKLLRLASLETLDTRVGMLSDEPRREKSGFLHMRKQRRRSASR